jgi:outer membrane protein OmpA-like peptidoglycan-associated protein
MRYTIFKVEVGTPLENSNPKEPIKDFYINAGSNDGLVESSILDVYRAKIVRDPATGQDSAISIPVGQIKVVKLFEDVTVARILSLTVATETPVLKYPTVMVGDSAQLAKMPVVVLKEVVRKEEITPEPKNSGTDIPKESRSADPGMLLPAKLLFRVNDWRLKPEAMQVLAKVLTTFQESRDRDVLIEGHTCSLGSPAYNKDLSRKRAQSVAEYLTTSMGIPADRVQVKYYGEKSPIASNTTKEGRVMNRSVVISFPPTNPGDAKPK